MLPLIMALAVGLQPGTRVTITVTSNEGPIAGARVVFGQTRVETDADGRVTMSVAPPTLVTVQADGFLPASLTLTHPLPSDVQVVLDAVPEIEEEVVADATRTTTRLADSPLRVEVIDSEEIEEKALMTPGSIAMLLAETTGLRVQTTAPSLGAANVRINGLRGRYTQLLADGLPLYGSQGDSLSLLQVPPLDLSRVEIVKGAASALHGPTALGGVVNLVTRRPAADHADLLVNLTTQQGVDAAAFLGRGPRAGWGLTLLGGFHSQSAQDLDDDGWGDVPEFARGVVRPRVFYDNGRGATMFVTAGLNVEDRRGGTIGEGVAPDGLPFRQEMNTTRADSGVVGRIVTSRGHVVTVRGSFSRTAQDRVFGDAVDTGSRIVWFGESSIAGVSGRHSWVAGGAVSQDRYRNASAPGADFAFTAPGLFVQDDIRFNEHVSASLSARLDVHSEFGAVVNPRVSVLSRPAPDWTLRASSGLGVFAPSALTEETEEVGFSRLQLPLSLEIERAWASSFDLTRLLGPVEVTATAFSSRVARPLTALDVCDDAFTLVSADEPAWVWGAEAIVRFRSEGFSLVGTYAWTRATELDLELGSRRETPLTPRHAVTFTAIRESEEWGRIGIEGYFTGQQALDDDPFRTVSRPYALVGILGERRFGRVRLFVNAENLGNIRQTKFAPLVRPTRRPDGRWTVDAWAPLDGLVVNGGVRLVLD